MTTKTSLGSGLMEDYFDMMQSLLHGAMCKAFAEFNATAQRLTSSEIKEVFIDILKLFHKILSHHQCFKVMERVKNAKKC
jgi:hypothetical protein